MKLSEKDAKMLENTDIVQQGRIARQESMKWLDEQGLAALSIAVANILDKLVREPESIIKEYTG